MMRVGEATLQSTSKATEEIGSFVNGKPDALMQILLSLCRKQTLGRIINCPTYPLIVRTTDLEPLEESLASLISRPREAPRIFASLFQKALKNDYRKTHGIYFTPREIALRAIRTLKIRNGETILDVGCGTGTFAAAMLEDMSPASPNEVNYLGVESDPMLALSSAVFLDIISAPPKWKLMYNNFLLVTHKTLDRIGVKRVDAIIANPPFVRFHRITDRVALHKVVGDKTGYHLSGLSGLHSLFIAFSSWLVREGGRMAFLLPSEMNAVNYAAELERQMQSRFTIQKIDLGMAATRDDGLRWLFSFVSRASPIGRATSKPVEHEDTQLSTFARVHRGISTGANDFFVLSESKVEEIGVPESFLQRVLPTRISFPKNLNSITNRFWRSLRDSDRPCYLLAIPSNTSQIEMPQGLLDYVKLGVREGVHMIPTCRGRKPWYSVRVSPVPEILFTYISRETPRFLFNEARIHILTNLLGVYLAFFKRLPYDKAYKLIGFLNDDLFRWHKSKAVGRVYSDGLVKFEPRELERMPSSDKALSMVREFVGEQRITEFL